MAPVRTPLNSIINYLEVALEEVLDERARQHLQRSLQASKSLVFQVNDLLSLTEAEDSDFNVSHLAFHTPVSTVHGVSAMFMIVIKCHHYGLVAWGLRTQHALETGKEWIANYSHRPTKKTLTLDPCFRKSSIHMKIDPLAQVFNSNFAMISTSRRLSGVIHLC